MFRKVGRGLRYANDAESLVHLHMPNIIPACSRNFQRSLHSVCVNDLDNRTITLPDHIDSTVAYDWTYSSGTLRAARETGTMASQESHRTPGTADEHEDDG